MKELNQQDLDKIKRWIEKQNARKKCYCNLCIIFLDTQ